MGTRAVALLALVGLFTMLLSPVLSVRADNVQNTVSAVVGSDTITVGGSTSVGYRIVGTGSDGCNIAAGTNAKVRLSIPAGVTTTPAASAGILDVTLTSCGTTANVGFSASAAGNYFIDTQTIVDSDGLTGNGYVIQSDFTLHVNPPADSTKPTITITSPTNTTYTQGAAVAADYSCADNVAVASCTGTVADGANIDTATLGPKTFTVNASDTAAPANAESVSVTYTVVAPDADGDGVPDAADSCPNDVNDGTDADNDGIDSACDDERTPAVSVDVTGTVGGAGWYTSDVTVDWTVAQGGSPYTATGDPAGCDDFSITTDQSAATYTCSATNGAGPATESVTIKRDATAPGNFGYAGIADGDELIYGSVDISGWSCTATDNLSGLDGSCDLSRRGTELGEHTLLATARDNAGNEATDESVTYTVVDGTGPVISGMPADDTIEATGPGGATHSWTAPTAVDDVDGSVAVICLPASGSTFPLGANIVDCTAVDAAENSTIESFTVTVVDTTAPELTVPGDITGVEATGPGGAEVDFSGDVSATDLVDGVVPVTCLPASGHTFDIETTTVECSATDAAGNTGTDSFQITVVDTTAPVFRTYADVVAEATGPGGAVVTYADPKTDDIVDGEDEGMCNLASGTLFEIGSTTVSCEATDDAGNAATPLHFQVIVRDTTAPVIDAHGNETAEATGPTGATVTYTAPATSDAVDGAGTASCLPASGSVFALGTTTVTCDATDTAGSAAASTTFSVTVQDKTAPVIVLPGNLAVPPTSHLGAVVNYTSPSTADAVDGAGLATCTPASGSTFGFGSTTVTCTAKDAAGNVAVARTFTVTVQNLSKSAGFSQPVDMSGATIVWNTIKGGNTVPLKFEVFLTQGGVEVTDTAVVRSFRYTSVSCGTGATIADEIEVVTTGSTVLRYDATGGQFIQNWKTPTGSGCYKVIVTLVDGQTIEAYFQTRK
jgi:hypothetical protein